MNRILAQAIWRAKTARRTGKNIPIRDLNKTVTIPVMYAKADPKPVVPPNRYEVRIRQGYPSVDAIIRATAEHYEVSIEDMISNRRTQRLVRPRQVVMYIARKYTPHSFPHISSRLGGRDHTTAMHGYAKILSLIDSDNGLCADIEAIKQKLGMSDATVSLKVGEPLRADAPISGSQSAQPQSER